VVSDLADIFQKYQLRSVAEASERRAANTVVVANHQLLLRAIRPLLSTDDSAHSSATTDDLDECVDRVRELASNARASDALARVRSSVADSIRTDEDQGPNHIIMVTNTKAHQDAELSMILAHSMQDVGACLLKGVVLNMCSVAENSVKGKPMIRARGTLEVLDMETVPVVIGLDSGTSRRPEMYASNSPSPSRSPLMSSFRDLSAAEQDDLASPGAHEHVTPSPPKPIRRRASIGGISGKFGALARDPVDLILSLYEAAPVGSVSLLVTSSMTEVAAFIRQNGGLFASKTQSVTVMGGITPESLADSSEELEPEGHTHNLDPEASKFVFSRCQAIGVRLIIVTRVAAFAASMPAFIFDELASTGHPIAIRMRDAQVGMMGSLWHRASLPGGHADRRGLPDHCDRTWFSETFCGGNRGMLNLELDKPSKIWPYVSALATYDPLTLVAACPSTLERFFEVSVKEVYAKELGEKVLMEHLIIGTPSNAGVRNPQQLRSFLMDAFSHSLTKTRDHALGKSNSRSTQVGRLRRSMGERWRHISNKNGSHVAVANLSYQARQKREKIHTSPVGSIMSSVRSADDRAQSDRCVPTWDTEIATPILA